MPKTEKIEKVAELKARIESSQALFLADFRGLTVMESGELRRSLRDAGARFSVVKNTLMKLAAGEAGAGELQVLLEGPTAVAFVDADPVAAAKSLVDATRKFRTLVLKGAYVEGRLLSPEQAQSFATIESREVLLAKMAGLAKAELARTAYMLNALQSRFLALLEAYREKQQPEEEDAAPEPEPALEAPASEGVEEPEAAAPAEDPSAEAPAEEPVAEVGEAEEPVAEAAEPEAAEPEAESEPTVEEEAGTSPAPQDEESAPQEEE